MDTPLACALLLIALLCPFQVTAGVRFDNPWEKDCEVLYADEARGDVTRLCEGAYGFGVILHESDLRQSIDVIDAEGRGYALEFWDNLTPHPSWIESYVFWMGESDSESVLLEIRVTAEAFNDSVGAEAVPHTIWVRLDPELVCVIDMDASPVTEYGKSVPSAEKWELPCVYRADARLVLAELVDLQAGDRGCVLVPAVSAAVDESRPLLADYSLCDERESLVGRALYLTYAPLRVYSEKCEGTQNCPDSENVNAVAAAYVRASGDCKLNEVTVHACPGFTACWNRDDSTLSVHTVSGTSVYGKTELSYGSVPYAGGGGAWLHAIRSDHRQTLYSGTGRWGPDGAPEIREGLARFIKDRRLETIICDKTADSILGPYWFLEQGFQESELEYDFFP